MKARRPQAEQPGPSRQEEPAARQRRALSGLGGGEVQTQGDEPEASELAAILARGDDAASADRLTHGFHSYPARMHPGIASGAIARFAAPSERVLDPFCGGGTVLVEAMVAGCIATGVDLNPLAVRLSAVRTALRDAASRERFAAQLLSVTEASLERVRGRVRSRVPLSPRERAFYEPHVLLELAGLREEILVVADADDRLAMGLVLSSLLVKLSNQRADTSEEPVEKRLRKGLSSELFLRKGRELVERWAALEAAAPPTARSPHIVEGDARGLPRLLGARSRYDLVLSSPPYGGTYDYVAHHARRYPWLDLDERALARGELGARRRLSAQPDGARRWAEELHDALGAIAAMCGPRSSVVLLVGDAEVGGQRIDAAEQLASLGPAVGLRAIAAASQRRREPGGGAPRREHLVLLRPQLNR